MPDAELRCPGPDRRSHYERRWVADRRRWERRWCDRKGHAWFDPGKWLWDGVERRVGERRSTSARRSGARRELVDRRDIVHDLRRVIDRLNASPLG